MILVVQIMMNLLVNISSTIDSIFYKLEPTDIKKPRKTLVGKEMWEQHWANCQVLYDLMQESAYCEA